MNKKGFTLIELLVVIAIIGILSSVAIVYLGDAKSKANDAKVQSNLTTASTQLEIDRANGTDLKNVDFVQDTDIGLITTKIGEFPCGDTGPGIGVDGDNVAWYHALCSDDTKIFCADSSGFRGETTKTMGAAVGTCN